MSLDFKLKAEYKIGGENRQYILDKAVEYITSKNLRLGTQGDRHHFLLDKVGLTETEYLECLNKATNGGVVREAFK
jgi:hypothetical protein|tara:strand:- start:394 stop:621 length:228 start_codon:yes stop_codon:yes gene_type:complete